jgi:hypothetical protein
MAIKTQSLTVFRIHHGMYGATEVFAKSIEDALAKFRKVSKAKIQSIMRSSSRDVLI